jgi:hypothetical protein
MIQGSSSADPQRAQTVEEKSDAGGRVNEQTGGIALHCDNGHGVAMKIGCANPSVDPYTNQRQGRGHGIAYVQQNDDQVGCRRVKGRRLQIRRLESDSSPFPGMKEAGRKIDSSPAPANGGASAAGRGRRRLAKAGAASTFEGRLSDPVSGNVDFSGLGEQERGLFGERCRAALRTRS